MPAAWPSTVNEAPGGIDRKVSVAGGRTRVTSSSIRSPAVVVMLRVSRARRGWARVTTALPQGISRSGIGDTPRSRAPQRTRVPSGSMRRRARQAEGEDAGGVGDGVGSGDGLGVGSGDGLG